MTEQAEEHAAKVEALKAKHGDEIAVFATRFGYLVFRCPERDAYEDFLEAASGDKTKKAPAMRSLAMRCVLEPERAALDDIFKKRPGLPSAIAGRLVEMASEDIEDLAKKD